jgi:glycosyl transferase family 25
MDLPVPYRVFVISLERAVERRAHMATLTQKLGLTAEFVSAVDGRKLNDEQRARYDRSAARRIYGVDMSDSEIGCYLSHYSIFEKMVAERIPVALIMEDDIDCDPDFKRVVDELVNEANPEWTVVRFQTAKTTVRDGVKPAYLGRKIAVVAGRDLCALQTNVLGACGYLIRLEAAESMLDYGSRIFLPIDQAMDRYWENGILPYVVRPMPVRQSEAFGSEIGNRGRAAAEAPSRIQILRRRLQRASDSINKRVFWMAQKTPVLRLSLNVLGSRTGRAAMVAFTAIAAAVTVGKG